MTFLLIPIRKVHDQLSAVSTCECDGLCNMHLFIWVCVHVFACTYVYVCVPLCVASFGFVSVDVCVRLTANTHGCGTCLSLGICMSVGLVGVCHCGVVCLPCLFGLFACV